MLLKYVAQEDFNQTLLHSFTNVYVVQAKVLHNYTACFCQVISPGAAYLNMLSYPLFRSFMLSFSIVFIALRLEVVVGLCCSIVEQLLLFP